MEKMIRDNIDKIKTDIQKICQQQNRNADEVILVGVTKYTSADKAIDAIEAGLTHLGENRVQEAQRKFGDLGDYVHRVKKHMIGHLQTNKVKAALQLFDMIQSVDSVKLAREIDKQANLLGIKADCLIQVNCSGEEQKFGVPKDKSLSLVQEIIPLESVKVLGLMTIAPFTDDEDIIRNCFYTLRSISEEISKDFDGHQCIEMKYLSMGMTQDYVIALEEGSNMLRIGSGIFQ